jgi:hypothetical protein
MAEKYLPLQEKFWMIEKGLGADTLQWMGDNYYAFCQTCMKMDGGHSDCKIHSFKAGKFNDCWRGEKIPVPETKLQATWVVCDISSPWC